MTGTEIHEEALDNAWTNIANYNTTKASRDMNNVYQMLVNKIVVLSKGDYFFDIGRLDATVIGQSEYEAKKLWLTPDALDIKRINKVFVKYSDSDDFVKCRYQNPWVLEEHPSYYAENQSKSDPFFYIQDESYFVYPAPTEVVTWGIEIFVIHSPADIDTDSVETDLEISKEFHYLIALWMAIKVLKRQGKHNEANDLKVDFDRGVSEMTTFIKQRYNQPVKKTRTWLWNFR